MENESVGKNNGVATIPFAAYQAAEVRWHKRLIAMALLIGFIVAAFLTAYVINDTKWKNLFAEYDYSSSDRDGGSYDDGGSYRRGRDRMGRFVSRSGDDMIERLKDMRDETDDPNERKEFDAFIKSIERRG